MPRKRNKLTKTKKKLYNGEVVTKHCGLVQAFEHEGGIYIKCNKCGQWIKLNID